MKLALRILSILLLILGILLSVALMVAATEVRKIGPSLADQKIVCTGTRLDVVLYFIVWNNASHVSVREASLTIVLTDGNRTIATDREVFSLAPGEAKNVTLSIAVTDMELLQKWYNGELKLYLDVVFEATPDFKGFPLLSYTISTRAEITRW